MSFGFRIRLWALNMSSVVCLILWQKVRISDSLQP